MREFVQHQQETRKYDDFLHRKVAAGRVSMHAGLGRPDKEVEAEFNARRVSALRQT